MKSAFAREPAPHSPFAAPKLSDLECLKTDGWLNDEILNAYFGMIIKAQAIPNYGMLNSFFLNGDMNTKGLDPELYQANSAQVDERQNRSVLREKRYLRVRSTKLIVPVNHDNSHWTCLVVCPISRKLTMLDSMGGAYSKQHHLFFKLTEAWLKCRMKVEEAPDAEWDLPWTAEIKNPVTQKDGNSCGLWAIAFAAEVVLGAPLPLATRNMDYFRLQVAIEISSGHLYLSDHKSLKRKLDEIEEDPNLVPIPHGYENLYCSALTIQEFCQHRKAGG